MMNNHFCVKDKSPPDKLYRNRDWLFSIDADKRYPIGDERLWIQVGNHYDCNECKHRLMCLLKPECDRKFESKRC